jgi:hypothetical protein
MMCTLHLISTAGAIILKISHGYDVMEHSDPFINLAARAMEEFCIAAPFGAYLVDFIPACRPFLFLI